MRTVKSVLQDASASGLLTVPRNDHYEKRMSALVIGTLVNSPLVPFVDVEEFLKAVKALEDFEAWTRQNHKFADVRLRRQVTSISNLATLSKVVTNEWPNEWRRGRIHT